MIDLYEKKRGNMFPPAPVLPHQIDGVVLIQGQHRHPARVVDHLPGGQRAVGQAGLVQGHLD